MLIAHAAQPFGSADLDHGDHEDEWDEGVAPAPRAIAAHNAAPHRSRRCVPTGRDPRGPQHDPVEASQSFPLSTSPGYPEAQKHQHQAERWGSILDADNAGSYRVENSHQPVRRRERAMAKFTKFSSAKSLQKSASIHASYQGAVIMTHRDRPCGLSGRREVAGDVGHRQDRPAPSDGSLGRPERRLGPRLSDSVAHGSRCPTSPRRTLLAENLGKPSL